MSIPHSLTTPDINSHYFIFAVLKTLPWPCLAPRDTPFSLKKNRLTEVFLLSFLQGATVQPEKHLCTTNELPNFHQTFKFKP